MTSARFDLVVIGSAIVDILYQADDRFLARFNITKGGMTLIDAEQAKILQAAMNEKKLSSGGSVANTAAGLAAFGRQCGFIGRTSNDYLGRSFIVDLNRLGIEQAASCQAATPDLAKPTGCSHIIITPDGERSMCTCLGINTDFSVNDLDHTMIAAAQAILIEGYLWDTDAEIPFAAAAIARQNGTRIALTLSDVLCVERHRRSMREFITLNADLVFANESEILSLGNAATLKAALASIDNGTNAPEYAITLSDRGCVILRDNNPVTVRTTPTLPVDTTGAGDLFTAGFLAAWFDGATAQQCGDLGNRSAAMILGQLGPRPTLSLLPLYHDVMAAS